MKWRLRMIRRDHTKADDAGPFPGAESWPTDDVAAHSASLSARITALRAKNESEERKQMRAEFDELSDRAWLSVIQEDVIAKIGRRKKRAELEAVGKDTATNRITIKSGEIAEQLVTNALRAKFSKEIDKLEVTGLAIELRKEKPSYGVPHFRVSLIRKPDARVGEILSEGEHRCVSLAAFLAELATTESRSAIVFDDPVSSLDHMHRKARRAAAVSAGRHFVPGTPVKLASGSALEDAAPLLEEKRDTRCSALIADVKNPGSFHRPRSRPRLAADDDPIDPTQIEIRKRTQEWLQREKLH